MWISHLNLGYKKLFALAVFSIVIFFAASGRPSTRAFIIAMWVGILMLTYHFGVHIRRKFFLSKGEAFEIIDILKFKTPQENRRVLKHIKSNCIESSIYLNKRPTWSYFDIIRTIILCIPPHKRRAALILGGGGGSVGYLLEKDYLFSHIDLVEHSKAMIEISPLFLPARLHISTYHHSDATTFVQNSKQQYTLVFADIFHGGNVDEELYSSRLLTHLPNLVSLEGILVLNLGYTPNIKSVNISKYIPHIMFCLWQGQLVGVWTHNKRRTSSIMYHQHALVVPGYS